MKGKQRPLGFVVILALGLALVLGGGFTRPAMASSEDVALFYDDVGQYGQWVDYENYGPVWSPSNVNEDWRPYTDGRWVPTNDGYVFESQEPWGWAPYHYGNWMPTPGYGWVWVPGRTWYPSTVEWRTSPETAPVDTSYVGWAPVPPPNYVPPPAYAPTGYYGGMPTNNLLTEPFWIFARAASFLLGFGQPYSPAYSYGGCGCLAPVSYVPVFYRQTVFCPTYLAPTYYPATYFGGAAPVMAYGYGPPVRYISRVTNINQVVINKTINYNTVNITRINNVVAPTTVLNRNIGIRHIQPPALTQGQPLPRARQVTNVNLARANLGKPNVLAAPRDVPPLRAQIPKAPPLAAQPVHGGVPGAALPTRATMQLTPQQQQQVQKLPPNQRLTPVAPTLKGRPGGMPPAGVAQPAQPAVPGKPGQVQPGAPGHPGAFQPGAPAPHGTVAPGAPGKPGMVQPGVKPGQVPPGAPAHPGVVPPGTRPGAVPAVPAQPAKPAVPPQPGAPGHPGFVPPGAPGAQPGAPGHPGTFQPGAKPGAVPAVPAHPAAPAQPARPGLQPAVPAKPATPAKPAVPPQPSGQPHPGTFQPGGPARPAAQPPAGYKPPAAGPGLVRPGEAPAAHPQPAPRPQPQMQPRPTPQPQFQPKPAPQPQFQPKAAPQPQVQPRPQMQPQFQPHPQPAPQPRPQMQPRPAPQPAPQHVAPAPRPQPAPHPQPAPQAHPQGQPKKPGEQQHPQ